MVSHEEAYDVGPVPSEGRRVCLNGIADETGVTQEAIIRPLFSSSTMQSLQAPTGSRWGWWHRVGILMPLSLAAWRMLVPASVMIVMPLMVRLTCSMVHRVQNGKDL